jgi:hypothetical protein
LTEKKMLTYLFLCSEGGRIDVDRNLAAAILAAVQAYIETEETELQRRRGPMLNAWKMGGRREVLGRRSLAERGNPMRTRLNRFSLR